MGLLDYIRDIAQGASNSVSSNVSGPVDLISWGLRKAGVPMPEAPVGGSQWMRNAGLLQDPKSQSAGLVGETLGLLAGPLAAAKAPQIAAGLLQGGENLAAARTLNPQTGAIVWHGSPHKFDKFDSSKIGTGEGAQAYGHGLYLAESDKVAGEYANMFAKSPASPAQLLKLRDAAPKGGAEWSHYDDLVKNGQGFLYKVDLPDEHIAKMLDWDKPLSQQPEGVRRAVQKVVPPFNDDMVNVITKKIEDASLLARTATDAATKKAAAQEHARLLNSLRTRQTEVEGKALMSYLGSPVQASEALRNAGIPGIRYLDGGSRSAGAGSSNFVVFPGNEGLLKILERNGGKP